MSQRQIVMDRGAKSHGFGWAVQKRIERYPEIGALVGFLVVFIGFAVSTDSFLTLGNLAGVLTVAAELGIMGVGVTFLMIAGEFDLSVGSVMGVAPMIVALLSNVHFPQLPALILALLFCALIGWGNGALTVGARIPSFIVTLGSLMLWRGLLYAVTGGFPVAFRGDQTLMMLVLNGRFGQAGFFASAFWFVLVVVIGAIVLNQTRYGNAVFAAGGDAPAARALGINVARIKTINFILCSVLAGFVGVIQFSRFESAMPTAGDGMELQAIAAAVIGGSLLTGGYGSMIGTMIGSLLMGMVASGLVLAGAPPYWYRAFIGVILVIAVIVNARVRGK
jgi:simple sugar transport system permease protein